MSPRPQRRTRHRSSPSPALSASLAADIIILIATGSLVAIALAAGADRRLVVGLGLTLIVLTLLRRAVLRRAAVDSLQRMTEHLKHDGYRALRGSPAGDDAAPDPPLRKEFQGLWEVIVDIVNEMRVNQTALIEAHQQAFAAEQAFRTAVEESPEAKILVRDGLIEIANPAAAHLFGLRLGDLLSADPRSVFAGVRFLDEAGAQVDLLEAARASTSKSQVVRCIASGQPDRWFEVTVAFIDSDMRDHVITARNITEERRLQALREEIVSLASHDIRSPLAVARGYLDILDRPIAEAQRRGAVSGARRALETLESLLNDLLDATQAEEALAPQVMRSVALPGLVSAIAESLQVDAAQHIEVRAQPDVTVLGDDRRLEQAITNLICNAIKHGPPQGEIRVDVFAHDGRAFVTVEDDGAGIPGTEHETLFERGARASQNVRGTGLGLYIVRIVTEAHNGRAYVDPGSEHTRFVMELPAVRHDQGSS